MIYHGEATSIFLKENKVGPVELATIAFGQRFEITPIQLATAVSSIANGGVKITPRVVKKIINSETGEVTEIPVKTGERIISEENAKSILSMMESVVAEGTGKNAQVVGYRVGGKTGTSEDGVNTNKYVASFCGVAPISDPQVVALVTLYNPTGEGGHQGGAWVILSLHYIKHSNMGSRNVNGIYGYYGRPLAIMVRFPDGFFETAPPPMLLLNQCFLILAAVCLLFISMQIWKRRRVY